MGLPFVFFSYHFASIPNFSLWSKEQLFSASCHRAISWITPAAFCLLSGWFGKFRQGGITQAASASSHRGIRLLLNHLDGVLTRCKQSWRELIMPAATGTKWGDDSSVVAAAAAPAAAMQLQDDCNMMLLLQHVANQPLPACCSWAITASKHF